MTDKLTIVRLPTGVPGLDDVLCGGFPALSFTLIAGQPGSGKTTLAHQLMFSMAAPERPALYFNVLGEPPLKMLRHQQQFDFFDAQAVNRSVRFFNLADESLTGDAAGVLSRIACEVEKYEPSFVFVDSFRSFVLASQAPDGARKGMLQFFQQLGLMMTSWRATTFLIDEFYAATDANPIFTVADGMIWLHRAVERNEAVRTIEIVKMRGQPTVAGPHPFRIGSSGVQVFAPASRAAAPGEAVSPASRVSTGVAGLDDMLGGGLPRGYSMLVSGPCGSGKTVLATAFLAQAARCGETAVLAAFDERPGGASGPKLAGLIASGRVAAVSSRALDLSVDEIAGLLMCEIRRLGATRVVIDSLGGIERAIAPSYRRDFRESLARLVAGLAGMGIAVLVTAQIEGGPPSDLRESPRGTAWMTDAVVVQRCVAIGGCLRRAMAAVKLAALPHSNEFREFGIDDDGIRVGDRFADSGQTFAGTL